MAADYEMRDMTARTVAGQQMSSDPRLRKEIGKAIILIWIAAIFIICQSSKLIRTFYEAIYCPSLRKKVVR